MSKLAQLREARNAKAREAQELNNRYPADQRMPAAEGEKLDAVLAEIEATSMSELSQVLERIRLIKGIRSTETSIHLATYR